jgi:hypothetical protein
MSRAPADRLMMARREKKMTLRPVKIPRTEKIPRAKLGLRGNGDGLPGER